MYYKAEITLSVTEYCNESQDWSGPYTEFGVIETITAPTLEGLKAKLHKTKRMDEFEVCGFEDDDVRAISASFSGENNSIEDYVIYLSKVGTQEIDAAILL